MGRPGKLWPEESELIQLVCEAQGGGPGALDTLLARLRPSFVAYFAPTMGRDDAEDAAQTALLSIVRTLPRIDAERLPGMSSPWLATAGKTPAGGEQPRHDASLLSNSPRMSNGPSRQT